MSRLNLSTPIIKVYGERNTGTNYLAKLIQSNLDVVQLRGTPARPINYLYRKIPGLPISELLQDIYFKYTFHRNLGWKHSEVLPVNALEDFEITRNNLYFITMSKNPYSWLLSLYSKPYHYFRRWEDKPDFETFLGTPSPVMIRENAAGTYASPIDVWNQKNASYIQLRDAFSAVNLKYEDLVANPEGIISSICSELGLEKKQETFRNREKSTKENKKDYGYYREYYVNEKWREKLSDEAITLIDRKLDDRVMAYYKYEKLS